MARLTKEQWESLKADYVTGAFSLSQLAKKYGVDKSAISRRVKKENWKQIEENELKELVEIEKVNKSQQQKVNRISEELEVKKEALKHSIEEITDIAEMLENNTKKLLSKQTKMMEEMADSDDLLTHSKVIKNLADAFKSKETNVNVGINQIEIKRTVVHKRVDELGN